MQKCYNVELPLPSVLPLGAEIFSMPPVFGSELLLFGSVLLLFGSELLLFGSVLLVFVADKTGNSGSKPFFRALIKSVVWKPSEIAVKNVFVQLVSSRDRNFWSLVPVVVVCVWAWEALGNRAMAPPKVCVALLAVVALSLTVALVVLLAAVLVELLELWAASASRSASRSAIVICYPKEEEC